MWYGIWSNMMIETTFMRYGKGNKRSGGLISVTIKPETAKKVTLSTSDNNTNRKHKEEMISRIASDRADTNNLREALQTCLDPLIPMDSSSEDIVNIYAGEMLINLLQQGIS